MKERQPAEQNILWTRIRHLSQSPGIKDLIGMGVPGQFRQPSCAARMKIGGQIIWSNGSSRKEPISGILLELRLKRHPLLRGG